MDCRAGDSPKRDWHAVACVAVIVSRSDVTLQETRRQRTAVLLERPGAAGHGSDVMEGAAGNAEHPAFLYDADRVQPSSLARKIVLPVGELAFVPLRHDHCCPSHHVQFLCQEPVRRAAHPIALEW